MLGMVALPLVFGAGGGVGGCDRSGADATAVAADSASAARAALVRRLLAGVRDDEREIVADRYDVETTTLRGIRVVTADSILHAEWGTLEVADDGGSFALRLDDIIVARWPETTGPADLAASVPLRRVGSWRLGPVELER